MDKTKGWVFCQKWEESERGWGTRPDGYSLHFNEGDLKKFIRDYWDGMPDEVPNEYSRPDGTPYWCEIDDETFAKVKASKNGLRFSGKPPGSGGSDGWMPIGPNAYGRK